MVGGSSSVSWAAKASCGRLRTLATSMTSVPCRLPPVGIRARVSLDNGVTWSDEVTLRQDGGSWDLGFVRIVLRPDGRRVTAYYYNTNMNLERSIQTTLWYPMTAFSTVAPAAAPAP